MLQIKPSKKYTNLERTKDSNLTTFCSLLNIDLPIKTEKSPFPTQYPLPLLGKVFEFIEENYHNQIGLREVAQDVKLSPAYLTDLVRRETGKTVLTWIKEHRMAKARQLLLETDLSIEQITEEVGYFERRHFNRQFLHSHQLSPEAWRKANKDSSKLLHPRTKRGVNYLTPSEEQIYDYLRELLKLILDQETAVEQIFIFEDLRCNCVIQTDHELIQVTFRFNAVLDK